MVVPGFTVDPAQLLMLFLTICMTGIIPFLWKSIHNAIANGDLHLEERIERMEKQHSAQADSIEKLQGQLQRIELLLNTLVTKFELVSSPKSRVRNG